MRYNTDRCLVASSIEGSPWSVGLPPRNIQRQGARLHGHAEALVQRNGAAPQHRLPEAVDQTCAGGQPGRPSRHSFVLQDDTAVQGMPNT